LFNTLQEIELTHGQLELSLGTATIQDPGANLLVIRGDYRNNPTRVFEVDYGVTASISGLTIMGGVGAGGLFNQGTLSLTNCTVTRTNGRGLFNDGTMSLTNCTVSGNSATGGGGLYNQGTLSLTDCTVSDNKAISEGGGLDNERTATLTDCTVTGNTAGGGGGLFCQGTATLTDCTVTGNTTQSGGGGLYSRVQETLTLTNCTVSGNSAPQGGGLFVYNPFSGTTTLSNTIVAGQATGGDIAGRVSGGNNLIGTGGSGGLSDGQDGNLVGVADPGLAPLGNYGGSTSTMPLLPGSPAIGSGTTAGAPATDQRGLPRVGPVDIGAFQSQGFTLTPIAGSTPQSARAGTPFANPLAVTVTANNPIEPVDGGVINFAAPATGASATLSAATATIAGGQASVTATANSTLGTYTVNASALGAGPGGFDLTNTEPPRPVLTPNPAMGSGSGDDTVSYRAGDVVLTDNVLGLVRVAPLAGMNSLTIAAPDGRPGALTIDESGGTFSLPGGIHFIGSASDPNQLTLIAGPGDYAIGIGRAGATLNGRSIVSWTNLDRLRVVGGDGTDQFRVSGNPQARGLITLVGGPGRNVYDLAAVGANLAVVDSTNHGTLDFHDAASGVTIDLRLDQGQPQAIGAGGNTLSLYGAIADLIGTPYDDVLHGNDLDNVIRGLGGDDVIIAGAGNSILIGGGGDDVLIAGPGRDLLIGGAGRAILIADPPRRGRRDPRGGSILIAGATAYDANDAALDAIMAEWASLRPRFARAHDLLDGRGSRHRLNGSAFLNAKTIEYRRTDTIVGDDRYDWLRLGRRSNKPYVPLRD
jgi:hypothetical protein